MRRICCWQWERDSRAAPTGTSGVRRGCRRFFANGRQTTNRAQVVREGACAGRWLPLLCATRGGGTGAERLFAQPGRRTGGSVCGGGRGRDRRTGRSEEHTSE